MTHKGSYTPRQWAAGAAALASGDFRPDPIPQHGDHRWGLSFVVRIEGPLADTFVAERDAIAARCRTRHLVYSRDHLHMTVRSLEGYQETVPEHQIGHYRDQLRRAVRGLDPVEARFTGLGGSPSGGLFVRGYPSASLIELRRRLVADRLPHDNLGVPGGDGEKVRDTAHVSLMVPRPPAVPEPEMAAYVQARSAVEFGTLRCASIALVRYRPTAGSVGLSEIDRVRL